MPRRLTRLCVIFGLTAFARSGEVVVTVLATTDLHGNVLGYDYVSGRPAARGLAKIATLIRGAERDNPNHLLVDCGDTIQGTPLEYAYQTLVRTGLGPFGLKPAVPLTRDPMMLAMSRLGYDGMTVGNHEFNFGLKNLDRARSDAAFPWISANTVVATSGGGHPFARYFVKAAGGVKVAVIGITTPMVPIWEKPENLGSYRFLPPVAALRDVLLELHTKEKPDLVVVAAHSGLGRNPETGAREASEEDVVYDLAIANPEVDAIVFGHSHRQLAKRLIGKVLVVQPKNWGMSLARLDFTMARKPDGGWFLVNKNSRLLPVTEQTDDAADIVAIGKPYHDLAEHHLAMPVTTSAADLDSVFGRVEDTPLVDAIQRVQLELSNADVSFTALFNPTLRIPRGQVTIRQIAALYPYENELYLIEGNGKMVKDALENAARYYLSCVAERCSEPPLINRKVVGFNFDMAEGVDYEIDLTRPEGDRIRNLQWHGKPLAPDQKLRIALNNYRAAGSAGYTMFQGAKVIWHSQEEIRDMLVRYYGDGKPFPVRASGNWRIIPDAALKTLEKQALSESRRRQLE